VDPYLPLPSAGNFTAVATLSGQYNQNVFVNECFGGDIVIPGQEIAEDTVAALSTNITQQLNTFLAGSNVLSAIITAAANAGLWTFETPPLSQLVATGVSSPTASQFAWSCAAVPGCLSTVPGGGLLFYCTKSCFGGIPPAPSAGLGLGTACLGDSQCASTICNSTTDTGSPPFVCCSQSCVGPCSVCGLDGACHNSEDPGCVTGQ
jgi:hypothetical protein